jgi:hypothetical protein
VSEQRDPSPLKGARGFRSSVFGSFTVDADGPGSADKILERLSAARTSATKESNRFLLISVGLVALYLIKIVGLRADLVLFGQKIFEVPYGVFLFCLASQVAMCLSLVRSSDARVFDRYMMAVIEKRWPESASIIYSTYPNEGAWLETTNKAIHSLKESGWSRALYSFSIIPTLILIITMILSPLLSGIYYLIDWEQQIVSGRVDLQYYAVSASTSFASLWLLNYILVHTRDHDDYV